MFCIDFLVNLLMREIIFGLRFASWFPWYVSFFCLILPFLGLFFGVFWSHSFVYPLGGFSCLVFFLCYTFLGTVFFLFTNKRCFNNKCFTLSVQKIFFLQLILIIEAIKIFKMALNEKKLHLFWKF